MKIMTMPSHGKLSAETLITQKHLEYGRKATVYAAVYYTVRIAAGLSAALLPFVVSSNQQLATSLSVVVVIATVVDFIFNPKDKWRLFSRATDLLAISRLRLAGDYEQYKELLDVLSATENANLEQLVNLDDLLAKVHKAQSQ